MSIISSEIIDDITQHDGKRSILEKHTDHMGKVYQYVYKIDSVIDVNSIMANRAISLLSTLDEGEQESAISRIESGEDSLEIVQNPIHSTQKKLAKKLLYWLIRSRTSDNFPQIVFWMESLILYLRSNYTASQLANFLDLTITQVQNMNTKINYILDNRDIFTNSNNFAEDL